MVTKYTKDRGVLNRIYYFSDSSKFNYMGDETSGFF